MSLPLNLIGSPNGTKNLYDLIANIVTDYGADPTGVVSCVPDFFTDFKNAAQGKRALLTIPNGSIMNFAGFGGISWVNGCLKLTVQAAGATLTGSVGLNTLSMGQIGIDQPTGRSARVKTINPGATTIELSTESAAAGHISRFAIGRYIMVTGWDIQGSFQGAYGFPPNFQWVEFRKITNIVGNIITVDLPMVYFYDQNWPEMHRGSAFEADGGGPATIFDLAAGWDIATDFNGGTYSTASLINTSARSFTMRGGISSGLPIFPSVVLNWRAENHTANAALCEVDKLIEIAEFVGGSWNQIQCQSSSTRLMRVNGGITVGSLNGAVKNTEVDNATITGGINVGPTAYGRCDTFICRNTSIGGTIDGGILCKGPDDGLTVDQGYQDVITMTGGVIKAPKSLGSDLGRLFMPDAAGRNVLFWWGTFGAFGMFKPLSVTQDPWPAVDNQSATVDLTIASGGKALQVSSPIFSAGDVGKVIELPGVADSYDIMDCTISNASPGVVTQNGHNRVVNEPVKFQAGSGVLPSGVTAGTIYYVLATGLTANNFQFSLTRGGAAINTSGGSGNVKLSYPLIAYTHITGFVDAQNVTIYRASTYFGLVSVTKTIRWGTCNIYVQTNEAGGLPNSALWSGGGKLNFFVPHARSVRFESCVGTGTAAQQAQVTDLNQAAAWDRPLFSYTKRTYNGSTGATGAPTVKIRGKITSIKINVLTPYTGAQGTLNVGLSQFNNMRVNAVGGSSYTTYGPRVNLKIAGERVIQVGSTTGAQSLDTNLDIASDLWTDATYQASISQDISAENPSVWPSFTIEIITDQGFP